MNKPSVPASPYLSPPRPRGADGEVRKVGVELEIGHLTLERTLEIVREAMGGEIDVQSRTVGAVRDTPLGKFKVEVDSKPLQERRYLRPLEALGLESDSSTAQVLEDSVLQVARELVPIEIVSPPIPWDRMHELDPLWALLREAGVEDTRSSVLHAFGLHFNPEPPDFHVETILNALRGFLLLEDWISVASDIDLSRKIAPYIRGFPESYRRKVLELAYRPTWDEFVDDFIQDNPTRNRPVDLMPLIAHIGAPGLAERVEDWSLVKPRPTYHYRLPNSEVAQANWTPAADWNRWVQVERVAEDPALLRELCKAYLETTDLPLRMQRGGWVDTIRERLSLPGAPAAHASTG